MVSIEMTRVQGDYGFEAKDEFGHVVKIDSSPANGGQNYGARPMQLLLMGLGGCSAIDIVSILKKQRQTVEGFDIKIEGERQSNVEPSLWQDVKIIFLLKGNIDLDKAKRACELSINKYCSVGETLRKSGTNITWEVRVN